MSGSLPFVADAVQRKEEFSNSRLVGKKDPCNAILQ